MRRRHNISIWISRLPLIVSSCLLLLGVLALALVVYDVFYLWTFLMLGALLVIAAILLCLMLKDATQTPSAWDIAVLAGSVLWAGVNIPFHAQHLLTDRDPATYTITGIWLANHSNLHIPKPIPLSSLPSMNAASLGFGSSALNPNELYAQGSHLLPALLGTAGKLFGTQAIFSANIMFGMVALLAFYGFARHLLAPRWAAFATLALSLSLPFLYFSRDTYTEPLALAFTFTALSWIDHATQSRAYRDWVFAGIAIGATVLVRPDAYISVAAFEVFLIIHTIRNIRKPKQHPVLQTLLCALPTALLVALGWIDLARLSSGYYSDLRQDILEQIILVVGIAALAIPGVIAWWHPLVQIVIDRIRRAKQLRTAVTIGFIAIFSFLLARALWLFALASQGKLDTMPVQEYSDHTTLLWILWYTGPILALTGIIIFITEWSNILRSKSLVLLPLLLVISADCALYLFNPRITPDQVWASRRFLPIIFPGFIVLGSLGLQRLNAWRASRTWLPWRYKLSIAIMGYVAIATVAVTSLPFWTMRAFAEEASVQNLCDKLPANALIVWAGREGGFATEPMNTVCHVVSLSTTATGAQLITLMPALQQIATAQHQQLYLGVDASEANLLPGGTYDSTEVTFTYTDPEHTYKKFPLKKESILRPVMLYRWQDD